MFSTIPSRLTLIILLTLAIVFASRQSALVQKTPLAPTCAPTPSGLVSFWPGDNTANDFQGSNNGALEGTATFSPGFIGPDFSFDGAGDVAIPSINVGSAFTIELWVFPTSPSGFQHMVSNGYTSSNYGALYLLGNAVSYWQGGAPQVNTPAGTAPANTWTHVALTYDGNAGAGNRFDRIYINGSLAGTSTDHAETFNNPLKFANSIISSDSTFRGLLDEISLYNRALSAAEIMSVFTAGVAGKCIAPSLFINDTSLVEGNAGSSNATLTINAVRHSNAVSVDYATADNTATSPSDYQSRSGTLNFPVDSISATVSVPVNGDTNFEVDETFFVNLTNASNATIADGQGVITIINDDCLPPPAGMVAWWPGENNASDIQGGNDGTLENGATFATGEVGQAFSFDGVNDSVLTPAINIGPAFTVDLWIFPTSAGSFQHLVSNDYTSSNYGALYFSFDHLVYYQNGVAWVNSGPIPLSQWTHVALTYDGSVDRLYVNGSLANTSSAHPETFNNALRFGYAVTASDQHFQGRLDEITLYSRARSALEVQSLFSSHNTGKCPTTPNLIINDVALTEGNAGTKNFTFTVTATHSIGSAITVNYATADGTATAPSDYTTTSGTLTIPANSTSATITVSVNGDATFELDETFFVNLSNATNANILDAQGVGTIINDDCFPPPSGLVGWWPAENNAEDIQGANNGVLESGANFSVGEVGQAFNFDGVDDSVLTPSINIGAAFTVELWMFPTSAGGFQHLVSNDFTSSNYGALYYSGNIVRYYQGSNEQVESGAVPLNQWTHLALTYDGSADRLYVNGNLIATSAATHSENFNNALRFGYAVTTQDQHFQGKLDEITLYNRALTGAEVRSIVNAHSTGKCVGAVNPVATWTGAVSADWNVPGNWNPAVPASTDDVVLPGSGVTNELVISSTDVTVNSLSIASGRSLTVNGGRLLTINGTLADGGTLAGAGTTNAHGGTIINSGVVSVANFNFNRAGAQMLNGPGNFASNTATVMTGSSLTLASGHQMNTLVIQGGAMMDLSSRTLQLSGSLMNGGVMTLTGSTLVANGASSQTLTSPNYNNLIVNNSAGVALGSDANLAGALTLTTDLATGGFILTMPNTATSAGGGDVVGNVRRTGLSTFSLSFGNPFNLIAISGGVAPTDVTVNLVKAAPVGFPTAVARTYTITPNGGSGYTATLRLHYQDSELNGNTEGASLSLFRFNGSVWHKEGQTAFDTANNWVEKTGVTQFSPWTMNSSVPTEASLESFTATGYDAGALLEWKTGYELDNLGFNIYRDEGGKRALISTHVIAGSALAVGQGVTLRAGRSYAWWDSSPPDKGTSYWIEDLDLNGSSRWYGPVSVQASGPANQDSPGAIEQAKLLASLGVSHSESAPVEHRARPAAATGAIAQQQFALASGPAVKLSVKQEGWYRVSQPELIAAGLNPAVDPRLLQLYVDGQQMAISVPGQGDGRFDPSDSVEFYGVGLDSPFSDLRVYWLVAAQQPGLRIASVPSQGWPSTGVSFPYTVERRDRTVYFSALRNGETENFFGAVIASQPVSQTITVRQKDANAAQPVSLEVALQGVTNQPHQVRVQLNGVDVGEITFNGQEQGVSRFSMAASSIAEGQNQIVLTTLSGQGDVSLVDYIRLTYQHGFIADDDALSLGATGQQQLTIGGFTKSDIRVFDVTNPSAVQEVIGSIEEQKTGYAVSLRVPGSGQKNLVALSDGQAKRPIRIAANVASNWSTSGHGADLIILSHRDFVGTVQPLVSARQKQGLSVAIVDVEDVYDEFSFGEKTPYAIRDFLSFARTNWKKPPRYSLLVGDATYDPKNYLGAGDFDFVPTRLLDTTLMEAASDEWLGDFDQDGIAEIAIGRLPVRTADEADRMIARIVRYDQSNSSEETLLVADRNDGYNFEGANDELKGLVNGDLRIIDIRRGQMSDAQAKTMLIEAINRGQKIVNYSGHGSVDLWRAGLLTSADASVLKNSDHLSLFVLMSCLNGYFDDPVLDSLAEAMMKAPEGGAVAVWASSAMTFPEGQALMNQELYRQLFGSRGLYLGDAIKSAKAAISDSDVRRSWILLGDPTMRLR